MAFAMPSLPPELAALFAQRAAAGNAQPGAPAPAPTSSVGVGSSSPMRTVFGMSTGTGVMQPKPAAPMTPPSDDPAISGAPATSSPSLPTPPDNSALTAERQKASDIESKIAGIHQPTPDDYKPSFWRKVASIPIAFAAGWNRNPEAGAQAAESTLYGPYHRAQAQYEAQVSPLQKQLDYERTVGVPLAESEAKTAQTGFENQLARAREQREQTAFQNETGDKIFQETGPDGKIHYYQTTKSGVKREVPEPREQAEDRRRREEDQNTPAPGAKPEPEPAQLPAGAPSAEGVPNGHQLKMGGKVIATAKDGQWVPAQGTGKYRVKTKAGGYMPWTPTTVEQGAMVGDTRSTQLFNREHPGRESKENPDENGYTPAEQREITQRTRRFNAQIDALNKQRANLSVLPDSPATKKMLDRLDAQLDTLYKQTDAVEQEVTSRRGKKQQTSGGQ